MSLAGLGIFRAPPNMSPSSTSSSPCSPVPFRSVQTKAQVRSALGPGQRPPEKRVVALAWPCRWLLCPGEASGHHHLVWVTLMTAPQVPGTQPWLVTSMPGQGLSCPTPVSVQGTEGTATNISNLVTPPYCAPATCHHPRHPASRQPCACLTGGDVELRAGMWLCAVAAVASAPA